jgi:hypothetical protein
MWVKNGPGVCQRGVEGDATLAGRLTRLSVQLELRKSTSGDGVGVVAMRRILSRIYAVIFDSDRFQKAVVAQGQMHGADQRQAEFGRHVDVNQKAGGQQRVAVGQGPGSAVGSRTMTAAQRGGRRRACGRVELLCSWLTGRLARRDWVQRG